MFYIADLNNDYRRDLDLTTDQFNFKQSDIYEDGELLNRSQAFEQSNDPGIHMLSQRPRKPVNHSTGTEDC